MKRIRLGILATHPIQYQTPWFRTLTARPEIDLEVLFCHQATPAEQAEAGFGVEFNWDVSLLDGYPHRFLKNVASSPTVRSFAGLDTPEVGTCIQKGRFDAVLVNGWHFKSAWQAITACWRSKTPVLMRSDSHLHSSRSNAKRAMKWPLYRWFIPRFDACLPAGTWSRDYFLHYGASPERVFVVPHAIDTDYFLTASRKLQPCRNNLRAEWGINTGELSLLFAGKFVENKRPLDFVLAIAEAARAGVRVTGLMAGDGPLRSACEITSRNKNVPIRFLGFLNQSEIPRAYVASDVLILPSVGETWGMVVNEAMTCGLPCIVSDHVGCGPDLIVEHETGASFKPGEIGQLSELIIRFAAHSTDLQRIGQSARKKAQVYSLNSATDSLLHAISAVTARYR